MSKFKLGDKVRLSDEAKRALGSSQPDWPFDHVYTVIKNSQYPSFKDRLCIKATCHNGFVDTVESSHWLVPAIDPITFYEDF